MLDYTLFGLFERCMRLNKVLAKEFRYFLRFYERRNKFRYQLKQKLKSKNEFKSDLCACVIQKFNGYNLLRADLDKEKIYISPIDIVYEPTQDIYEPIYCYFAPKIGLAFHTIYERNFKGKKVAISSLQTKQCPYCKNFFLKSEKRMEHVLCCSGRAGIDYSLDNGNIINCQDNFSKIGTILLQFTTILK